MHASRKPWPVKVVKSKLMPVTIVYKRPVTFRAFIKVLRRIEEQFIPPVGETHRRD